MPSNSAPFDIFASYAHTDDRNGDITTFIEQLKAAHNNEFPDQSLTIFFDQREIRSGQEWETVIHAALRESRICLAFVSPAYFASQWCRREWEAWIARQIQIQLLGKCTYPIYTVALPILEQDDSPGYRERFLATLIAAADCNRAAAIQSAPSATFRHFTGIARYQFRGRPGSAGVPLPFFPDGAQELRAGALAKILKSLATELHRDLPLLDAARQSKTTVPDYNQHFTGRLDELLTLHDHLHRATGLPLVGIHGLGGLGKTELAFTYAHAYAHCYPGGRYLIPCEGKNDLRLALLALDSDPLPHVPECQRKNLDEHFRAVRLLLKQHSEQRGRTLLIFDNVSDLALLSPAQVDLLSGFAGQLHIIATTRLDPPMSHAVQGLIYWLPIDRLPEDDAVELLRRHRDFEVEDERRAAIQPTAATVSPATMARPSQDAAREIVRLLGGFTIAVELAAAFLTQHPDVEYAAYLERLRADSLDQLDQHAEAHDITLRRHNDEQRLASILGWTLGKLVDAERHILNCAAFMAADYVVLDWLRFLAQRQHADLPPPVLQQADQAWSDAIYRLKALSLFTRPIGDAAYFPIVRTHRLLQQYLIRSMTDTEPFRAGIRALVAFCQETLQRGSGLHQNRWAIPALYGIAVRWDEDKHPDAPYLLNSVGLAWMSLGEPLKAEPSLRRAVALVEALEQPNWAELAGVLSNLGYLLRNGGQFAEAERVLRRALDIYAHRGDEDHETISAANNHLAEVLMETHRLVEAEAVLRQTLARDEIHLGPEHVRLATTLNNLGELLSELGRYAEAEPLLRRALAMDDRILAGPRPNIARDLNNLATLCMNSNRMAEAEPLLRRALAIDAQHLGDSHPNVGRDLHNLAVSMELEGRWTEAVQYYRRILEIDETNHGPNHFNVASSLTALARCLCRMGLQAEAEPLLRRALDVNESIFGPHSPSTVTSLNELANIHSTAGRLQEAGEIYRQALGILDASGDGQGPKALMILFNILRTIDNASSPDAAMVLRRALAICDKNIGLFCDQLAYSNPGLVRMQEVQIGRDLCDTILHRAIEQLMQHPERDDPQIAVKLNNLTLLLVACQKPAEAEPIQRRALAIDEAHYGPDHPEVATDLRNLAPLLAANHKNGEAIDALRRCLAIRVRQFGRNHADNRPILHYLIELGTNHDVEDDELESLVRQLVAMDESNHPEGHADLAESLSLLAMLLCGTRCYHEAVPLLRRSIVIEESISGTEAIVAQRLDALANCLIHIRDYAGAQEAIQRILHIDGNTGGVDQPQLVARLLDLGEGFYQERDFLRAEECFRRALTMCESDPSRLRDQQGRTLNDLGGLLYSTKRPVEAETVLRKAVDTDSERFGKDHPALAVRLYNLAKVLEELNRFEEAGRVLRDALVILLEQTRKQAKPHPQLCSALRDYASICQKAQVPNHAFWISIATLFSAADIDQQNSKEILAAAFGQQP